MDSQELLTVRQVARLLQVSPRQVWRLARTGALPPPLKIGGATRWRAADIERALAIGRYAVEEGSHD